MKNRSSSDNSKRKFSKVKIICTLGPASQSVQSLTRLIRAEMNVARINFSHGTYSEHRMIIKNLREASRVTGESIAILQDLQGPKIRVGEFIGESVKLLPGKPLTITTEKFKGTESRVSTTYQHLHTDVKRGDRILLDDGKLELRVENIKRHDVNCIVVTGGFLSSHKGINLPGVAVSAPSLTGKDKEDLLFGLDNEVDYVALSFVRRAKDIVMLREFIGRQRPGSRMIPIISKVEKPEAIDDIDAIIEASDAIMIARGDLGVEMPAEEVPILQKMIVRKCNEQGKPVIIATQMLESMVENSKPTRAEASDVANAVLDGADAVMLSEETSVGKYPSQAVDMMKKIIVNTEDNAPQKFRFGNDRALSTHPYDPLAHAACMLADYGKADAIVTLTHSGATASHIAKFRPPCSIIAVTDHVKIIRRLNLVWGVRCLLVDNLHEDSDTVLKMIRKELLKKDYLKPGDTIVMVAGIPIFKRGASNTISLDKV
ncbi:MAG: pyruvate kinase [Bacteroidota bacterium]